ncbi:MAG: hypothetical protein MHMPM18_004461, partial [Marteilia pararefringens]
DKLSATTERNLELETRFEQQQCESDKKYRDLEDYLREFREKSEKRQEETKGLIEKQELEIEALSVALNNSEETAINATRLISTNDLAQHEIPEETGLGCDDENRGIILKIGGLAKKIKKSFKLACEEVLFLRRENAQLLQMSNKNANLLNKLREINQG